MYGRTLEDFPDRPDAFLCALGDLSDADINAGFEIAVKMLQEFPVPAHIRKFASEAERDNHRRLTEQSRKNQRLIEDRIKDSRFEETSAEERRKEFAEMVAKAARELGTKPTPKPEHSDRDESFLDQPERAVFQSPEEYEQRMALLRKQADDLKRQAGVE